MSRITLILIVTITVLPTPNLTIPRRSKCRQFSFPELIVRVQEVLNPLESVVTDLNSLKFEKEEASTTYFRLQNKLYYFLANEDNHATAQIVCNSKSLKFIEPDNNFADALLTLEPKIKVPNGITFKSKEFWVDLNKSPTTKRGFYSQRVSRVPQYWGLTEEEGHKVQLPEPFDTSACHTIQIPSDLNVNSNFVFLNKDCDEQAYTLCQSTLPSTFDANVESRNTFKANFESAQSRLETLLGKLPGLPKLESCAPSTRGDVTTLVSKPSTRLKNLLGKNKLLQLLSALPSYYQSISKLFLLQNQLEFSNLSSDESLICLCSEPEPEPEPEPETDQVAGTTITPVSPNNNEDLTETTQETPPDPSPPTYATPPPLISSSQQPPPLPSKSSQAPTPPNADYSVVTAYPSPPSPVARPAPQWHTLYNHPDFQGALLSQYSLWNSKRLTELIDDLYQKFGTLSSRGESSQGTQTFHFNINAKSASKELQNLTTNFNKTEQFAENISPSTESTTKTAPIETTSRIEPREKISENSKSLIHLIFAILGSSAGLMAFLLTVVLLCVSWKKNQNFKCCNFKCCKMKERKRKSVKNVQARNKKYSKDEVKSNVHENKSSSNSSSQDEQAIPLMEMQPILELNDPESLLNVQSPAELDIEADHYPNLGKSISKSKRAKKRVVISNEVEYGPSGRRSSSTHTAVSSSSNECIPPYRFPENQ